MINSIKFPERISILRNLLIVFFAIFIFTPDASGDSKRTNATNSIYMIYRGIQRYLDKNDAPPATWENLINEGWIDEKAHGFISRYLPNFEFLYQFPAIEIKLTKPDMKETVIVMSVSKEVHRQWGRNVRDPQLRLLLVQGENGHIYLRQYTEEYLEKLFTAAGLDLADYTGPEGKWAPVGDIKKRLPPSADPAQDLPETPGEASDFEQISTIDDPAQEIADPGPRSSMAAWLFGILGVTAILAAAVIFRKRKAS